MQNIEKNESKSFYMKLWFWVLVAMVAGIIFGATCSDYAIQTKPMIDWFILVIKLLVGPIIFLTVVSGIVGMGDLKKLGSIGIKTIIYFEVVSSIALIIGMFSAHIFGLGHGMNLSVNTLDPSTIAHYVTHGKDSQSILHILYEVIPSNPISPFIEGNTIQVLFMAIIFGLLVAIFANKYQNMVMNLLGKLQTYVFKLLSWVMFFAPFAAFSAMAFMVGKFGVDIIINMGGLVLLMLFTCLFFIIVVLGIIAKLNGFNIFKFLRLIYKEILLVFATSSSESALGPIMKKLTDSGASKTSVGVVVPAGYSFNLDGTNIYLTLVIVFLCQAFNIHLSWEEQLSIIIILMITSKGAAGVTGAGFIVLAGTLSALGGKIPVLTIAILLGIDKIMSELRSTTNLVGNSVAAILIAKWSGELDMEKLQKVLDNPDTLHDDVY